MSRGKSATSALATLRKSKGLSQEEVASRITEITGEEVGQAAVSYWELGKVDLKKVHPRRVQAYAEALGISEDRLAEAAGLDPEELFPTAPARKGPPVPPVVPFRETPVSIPRELQEMIDKHSGQYPMLRDPTIQRIIAAPRNFGGPDAGPQTAEDWFEYWMVTKRYIL